MAPQALSLPQEIQARLDDLSTAIIELAKRGYNNPLLPFEQYSEKVRFDLNKDVFDLFAKNQHAHAVLKAHLELEEKEDPSIPEEARLATWQKVFQDISKELLMGSYNPLVHPEQKSIQEQFHISWNFIDRVYAVAEHLIDEGQYQDAASIFGLLILIHPLVQEYWIRKAVAHFGAGEYETALDQCAYCLIIEPDNPEVFFEMARIYFKLQEIDHCLGSLNVCLKYCGEEEKYQDLKAEATAVKQEIQAQGGGNT